MWKMMFLRKLSTKVTILQMTMMIIFRLPRRRRRRRRRRRKVSGEEFVYISRVRGKLSDSLIKLS